MQTNRIWHKQRRKHSAWALVRARGHFSDRTHWHPTNACTEYIMSEFANEITPTQQAILDSARKHFVEQGFKSASLNKIVADAGFTKGAFYGYYASKEELFDALVASTANGLAKLMADINCGWSKYPETQQMQHLDEAFFQQLPHLSEFIVSHRDDIRLILTKSEGTRYEGFIDSLVNHNSEHIEPVLQRAGLSTVDPDTYNLLMSAYYNVLAQIAIGNYDQDQIVAKMHDVQVVFQSGITALAGKQQSAPEQGE